MTLCTRHFALLIAIFIVGATHAIEWHVSVQTGSDQNPGSQHRPFKTLSQARDAIRQYRREHVADDQKHTVFIHSGRYHLDHTFTLTELDSGTAELPVVYRAVSGASVVLSTGLALPIEGFRLATVEEAEQLAPAAKANVFVLELQGAAQGKAFPAGQGDYGMLVSGQYTLQLARWPNRGFVHLRQVIDMGPTRRWLKGDEAVPVGSMEEPVGGRFTLRESTDWPAWQRELQQTRDVWQNGYLSNDWTVDENRLARVSDDGVLQLVGSTRYGVGGIRYPANYVDPAVDPKLMPFRRLFFENLLCELDMPGEWYYDRIDQKLYYWPIGDDPTAEIVLAGGQLMVELNNTSHVVLQGLTFDAGGDLSLAIRGGENNLIAACTFRNLAGRAFEIQGGKRHSINGCDILNAESAFSVTGGDLRKLERADHEIVNCDFSRLRRKGYGGGGIRGCGITFRNNIWHDMNAAINYDGAYIEFINNEFFNIGWEMGDWNVLYQGADLWCNGNRVQNNFFHHMMEEPGRHPILAVRNDDGGSGTTYESNLFLKTGRGAIAFAGPANHVLYNVVLDCPLLLWTARRPITPSEIQREYDVIAEQFESGRYARGGKEDAIYNVEQVVGVRGWEQEPWKSAFPDFARYMNENPFAQSYGSLLYNYHDRVIIDKPYGVVNIQRHWSLAQVDDQSKGPATIDDLPGSFQHEAPMFIDPQQCFVDPAAMDFRIKPGFEWVHGFRPINIETVGLFHSEFRPDLPDASSYRQELYNRLKDVPSTGGKYDPEQAYLRYPAQPWLENDGA